MTETLVLYTHPMSRGRVARWMLEEVGRPYEVRPLHYATEMKAPDYLAINPMGKVPALMHGRAVVTETAAICAYLADAFPEAQLAPPPGERAAYHRWMYLAAGPFEAATINAVLGFVVPAERQGMVGYGSLARMLDAIEAALADVEHVAGDRFSAADVVLGSQLAYGTMFGTVEKRPAFLCYVERLDARPAAARARAADDALLAQFPPRGA